MPNREVSGDKKNYLLAEDPLVVPSEKYDNIVIIEITNKTDLDSEKCAIFSLDCKEAKIEDLTNPDIFVLHGELRSYDTYNCIECHSIKVATKEEIDFLKMQTKLEDILLNKKK